MAIVLTKDEKDPVGYAAQATQPAGAVLSVADGGGTIGGGGGAAASTANPGKSLANFPDVNAYLDANKGTASNQMTGAFENMVNGAIAPIRNDFNSFKSSVDSAVGDNSHYVYPGDQYNFLDTAGTHPNQISNDPGKFAKFRQMYNETYQGPNSWNPGDSVLKNYNDIEGINDVNGLMSHIYGQNNSVTPGMKSLDNLIVGSIPDAYNTITKNGFNELRSFLDDSKNSASKYVQNGKNLVNDTRGRAQFAVSENAKALNNLYNKYGQGNPNSIIESYKNPYDSLYGTTYSDYAKAYEKLSNNPNLFSWV